MYWNYRIVRYVETNGGPLWQGEIVFALREVFYENDGTLLGHSEPSVFGNDAKEAREVLENISLATDAPIIDWVDDKNPVVWKEET